MADTPLAFDRLPDALADIVKQMEAEVPYASGLGLRRQGTRVAVSSTQSSVTPEPATAGVVLTAFNGACFYEASVNDLRPSALQKAGLELARWAASQRPQGALRELDPGQPLKKDYKVAAKEPLDSLSLKDRLARAQAIRDALAKASPKVRNATGVVADLLNEAVFVNRVKRLTQSLPRVEELMQVVVSDGKGTQSLFDGLSRGAGFEALGHCVPLAAQLVADAERLLTAPRLEPGFYDIVTHPDWSGILAHEAFGHGTETDMYLKDRAKGKEYMGKRVGSELVNLMDDPTLAGHSGTFFFDDEGALASPTQILKNGVLVSGMTDYNSASVLGYARTANGRRESWERKAYARMTNTFFAPGSTKPADVIKGVEDGIYLRYASNGMEDPQGWGIQCEGLWGEEIKKGKLTGKVYSPVIMTGFVPDILASISAVGDDFEISGTGYCGKGHKEWVKNTTGGPHLRLRARLA